MNQNKNDIEWMLEGEGQQMIAKAVASLPDEPLSLVWRSNLNEALREKSVAAKRRRWVVNFLSPVAGLGAACALAAVVFIRPSHGGGGPTERPVPVSSSIEAGLVQLHQDDLRSFDVAGAGLNPTEAANDVSKPASSDSSDSSEDDFDF